MFWTSYEIKTLYTASIYLAQLSSITTVIQNFFFFQGSMRELNFSVFFLLITYLT